MGYRGRFTHGAGVDDMSDMTYNPVRTMNRRVTMGKGDKPLVWLRGEVKTPPFSPSAQLEAGYLLRLLQQGESLGLPHSRPMPVIGPRCHELRISDNAGTIRVMYRADTDAAVILDVFLKKTQQTPQSVITACTRRLHEYDRIDEAKG
jgi:phage-related protein